MASSGNPNQSGGFDMQKLFKPGNPQNPNPNPSPPPGYGATPSAPQFPIPYSTPQHPNISNLQAGPFSYPPQTSPYHHYLHYPPETHPPLRPAFTNAPLPSFPQQQQLPTNQTHLPPSSGPAPNPGARLMALLGPQSSGSDPLVTPTSLEFSSPAIVSSAESYTQLPASVRVLPKMPTAPPINLAGLPPVPVAPARLPSSKPPKGRHISGDHVVYDIGERLPGEAQPQLEVNPITKYVSDPALVVGRQIAVNGTYICYGLKPGAIRVLNINTALRHLLKGHSQRVTDMAFFAEDVHLLASASMDGRVFIWKITEGLDQEDKPQVVGRVILAIQMVGDRELFCPRVCWHTHKQEVLMVGIGNYILRIDTTKVAKEDASPEEEPIKCLLDKPINGISCIGKHDGDVTDLSICQWMSSRLASASTDGTVKIWGEKRSSPLAVLRPHDGQPVNSVSFLVAPEHPDHIVLLTSGPFSRELKLWASASPEGWLLHSEVEDWLCMHTLELKSSSETSVENAFFNQVVVLPRVGLILLANAKKNAIYAVHLEYGPNPAATRMNYIAEFTVTMPILSLTGTSDCLAERECIVQIYCVQTQAIQQYTLDLFQCLPPHVEHVLSDLSSSGGPALSSSDGLTLADLPQLDLVKEMVVGNSRSKSPLRQRNSENASADIEHAFSAPLEVIIPRSESNPNVLLSSRSDGDNGHMQSPNLPQSPGLSGRFSDPRSPPKRSEQWASPSEVSDDQIIRSTHDNLPDIASSNAHRGNDTLKTADESRFVLPSAAVTFDLESNPTHLITPSEILSMGLSSEKASAADDLQAGEKFVQDIATNHEIESMEVEVKVVGEAGGLNLNEAEMQREAHILTEDKRERTFYSQASEINPKMTREYCSRPSEMLTLEETLQVEDSGVKNEEDQPSVVREEEGQISRKDAPIGSTELSVDTLVPQLPTAVTKGKKQKTKPSQPSQLSSASPSPFNSTDSSNGDPGSSSGSPAEVSYTQILHMQDSLNQLMTMHKEMQKQMSMMVTMPISKEGKRIEAALVRHMEKIIKANVDAMWARMLEENAKHEKAERDRVQQITTLISNAMNKDFPAMMDRTLKKEIAAIGPTIIKSIVSVLDKTIPSAVADSFQKGIGDKVMNQLEKSICSKLETAVSRQIQAQVQTCIKQALQDAVKSSIENSLIPAFELSCKSMFEQVDATFQKGIGEYVAVVHQQFESTHASLALGLRDGISSLASAVQTLNSEVAEGQRKILAFAASRAHPVMDAINNAHLSNGSQVEAPPDPTKELTRLISEHKFEEAFTLALQSTDLSLVSWLCSQVNLMALLSTKSLPLSQGVLLSLIQQLACDLGNDTSLKLSWVTEVAIALNPSDPLIVMHARPILEQVYQMLGRQLVATSAASELSSIRMIMHVISSTLKSCK